MSSCPGCWTPQHDPPPSHEGDWWCMHCLNKKISTAVVHALIYHDSDGHP